MGRTKEEEKENAEEKLEWATTHFRLWVATQQVVSLSGRRGASMTGMHARMAERLRAQQHQRVPMTRALSARYGFSWPQVATSILVSRHGWGWGWDQAGLWSVHDFHVVVRAVVGVL